MKIEHFLVAEGANPQQRQAFAFSRFGGRAIHYMLGAILLLATLLRVASALLHGEAVVALPGIYDQISYHTLAQRVMAGHGFSFEHESWPLTRAGEPTAHWSYLYTLYLTAVYTFGGVQPLLARLLQAVIAGCLHSWLVWRIGRRIFGPTVGLVAAASSAIYLYFVYYAGALLTETFYIIGILWTFDIALRLLAQKGNSQVTAIDRTPSWRLWLALGLAIGTTALLRQVFLFFVPFLFLWLWWNLTDHPVVAHQSRRFAMPLDWSVLKGVALTVLVIGILIAPWTIRNYRAFGLFAPLNTNAGYAFFWGNHPIYGANFVAILPDGWDGYKRLIPVELRPLNEAALDRALLKQGIAFVVTDPIRYARLSVSRTREYFKFWPSAESGLLSNVARVGSFGLFLPLMLYGLWNAGRLLRKPADRHQRAGIVLLLLFIVIYSGIHLLTWALIRYRLPVDAMLLIFAAVGIVRLASRLPPLQRLNSLHGGIV
jgi:4-amino-4-deoxy-L-arabinose transferase-like glycosyltransferase